MERKLSISEENRKQREMRTPEQQLAILDERLGPEIGAKREREILISQIAERLGMNEKKAKDSSQSKPKTRSARRKAKADRNKRRK